jgi:Methyltransferase FkbM domain
MSVGKKELYGPTYTHYDVLYRKKERAKEAPVEGDIWTKDNYKYARDPNNPFGSWYTFNDDIETPYRDLWWTQKIKAGDVVIDAGAQYGSYTLPACANGAYVYAFEPHPDYYKHLVTNIKLNEFKCSTFQAGLYSKPMMVDWDEIKDMKLIVLDDVLGDIQRLDFIKIDVEGAELEVLKGAQELIKKFDPKIMVETHVFLDKWIEQKIVDYLKTLHNYEVCITEVRPAYHLAFFHHSHDPTYYLPRSISVRR